MGSLKRFLFILALTCMWSPSFLFIKLAVQDLPPLTTVSLRVSLAACVFLCILKWKAVALPKDLGFWSRISVMALFSSVVPFCLFCYAEQTIESALAAILNGATPMFTAVLAQIFVASDRMNFQKILGVMLSCLGLFLLFAPTLWEGVDATTLGMSAGLIAALCYAISHVYGKLYVVGYKPFVAPTAQMAVSSLMLWPLAIYYDQVWTLPAPSASAIGGVCGLALFGTVFAFIIYYYLLERCGPTAISTVACFLPVVGMFLGFLFLGETFTSTGLISAMIILTGMLLVNEVVSFKGIGIRVDREQG